MEESERDGMRYVSLGEMEGYHVYIHFPEEGPAWEEHKALFEQAVGSILYRSLAACIGESAVEPDRKE